MVDYVTRKITHVKFWQIMLLLDRRRYMHASNDVIMTAATNPEVLAICHAQGWCASADKMTKSEAEQVTTAQLGSVFRASNIVHFDEFAYFVNCDLSANAFRECASLTSIVLPSSVTNVPQSAFYNDSRLTTITLSPNITSIGNYAFYGCALMQLAELPSGITSIGENAFRLCAAITLTALPNGLTAISAGAFQQCTNLALTALPSGVATIGANAFYACSNINISSWSTALTTIGNWGFRNCHILEQIELPSTCTEIGDVAFGYNEKVHTITCRAMTAPTIYSNTFLNTGRTASTRTLRVPSGASGYDQGYWQDLQDTNGFTLQYI